MGIHGLTSFLNKSYLDNILVDLKLNGQLLLVDGYSLLYKFHHQHCLQSTHGGNYDEFVLKLDNLFDLFKKCKLEPVFLFDGGRDKFDRKFQTNLKRANDRVHDTCALNSLDANSESASGNNPNRKKSPKFTKINLVNLINSGNFRIFHNFLPIMSFQIFFDLIEKYEFVHFQTNFEADYELACLANELNAIILSSDSDFYVYDLKNGYIPIDYFDMDLSFDNDDLIDDKNQAPEYYLTVKIYKLDSFLDYYNKSKLSKISHNLKLNKIMLPIFAILLGNDYVDQSTFRSLLNTFESSNNNMKFKGLKRSVAKRKDLCFNRLLEWLAKYDDNVDLCVETMLKFVKKDLHEQIRFYVKESINEYMCLKPSSALYYKNLILVKQKKFPQNDDLIENLTHLSNNQDLTTYNGNQLPEDFLRNFLECKLNRFCLDALIHRKVIFRCQLEVADWPSTFLSSINIRNFFYSILIKKYEKLNENETFISIKEYLRYQNQIKIYEINIEPNMIDLNKLITLLDHYYIFNKIFDFNSTISHNLAHNFSKLNIKIKYFFSIIYFWLNSINRREEIWELNQELKSFKIKNCIKAFLVSFLKCSIVDPCFKILKASTKNSTKIVDTSSSSIRNYELNYANSNISLVDQYFSNSDIFLQRIINDIIANEANFDYIKEISIKLNNYCPFLVINNSLISKSSNNKANKLLNLRLVHCLCEFQSIFLSLNYAREVMNLLDVSNSIDLLNIELFFNGTFLHNFIEELDHRVKPDLFIEEVFGRKSIFKYFYMELVKLFDNLFLIDYDK